MIKLEDLTLEEKINFLTGVDRWRTFTAGGKVKEVKLSDGPNGLRYEDNGTTLPNTAMPTLSTVACTWDESLAKLDGETIAEQCIEKDVDVLLAPGVNIKRTPLNGRNFEYFSEDPLLAGLMAKSFIEGVQGKGIGTSLKHFCANNREYERYTQSSEIDERTLREIYIRPFEYAVKAKPWTVMCSYNLVNGVYMSENKKLLNDVLRDQLGFDGLIMSDWGAVTSSYKSAKATIDLSMPNVANNFQNVKEAYEKGYISESEIDACVKNLLSLAEKSDNNCKKITFTKVQRHENAVKIAKGGIVLLKNDDNILPLKKGSNYAVFGARSIKPMISGLGSAEVPTDFVQTPLNELLGTYLNTDVAYYPALTTDKDISKSYRSANAIKIAYNKDAVIVFVNGEDEGEEYDRKSIRLHKEQEALIENLYKVNKNIIVLVNAGSAIDMSPWIDKVKAVLFVGYSGEGINEAISSILVGETNPSGKLAETFPLSLDDTPTKDNLGNCFYERYDEGVFVGYRYYDEKEMNVLFPFGYGLSYSKFEYSNLKIDKLGETEFEVSFDITNASKIDGYEVAQIYVKDIFASVSRPPKELKAFKKVFIKAGETKKVKITLSFDSFAFYNVSLDKWYVENGDFKILVGASSRDIKLFDTITVSLPDETQLTHI